MQNMLRGRAFAGPGGEERAWRVGLRLRAAIYDDYDAQTRCRELGIVPKAQGGTINTAGGFLAADELQREILSLRDLAGVFRANAFAPTIGSDSRSWPRRTSGAPAAFVSENTALAEQTADFDAIRFSAKKLGAFVRLSTEINEDETVSLAQWFVEELAWGLADVEDGAAFTGDGTSTYAGIRGMTTLAVDGNHNACKYTAANGHNTFATLDATDIAGLIGTLPAYAHAGAAFYVSHVGFADTLCRLAQSSGALTSHVINGAVQWYYLGYPVHLTPKLPTATTTLTGKAMLFLGDLRLGGAIGTRKSVTISRSEDRYLDTDQVAVKGVERMDVVIHGLGDNTTAGPIVALVAP